MDKFMTYVLSNMHITEQSLFDIRRTLVRQKRLNSWFLLGLVGMGVYIYTDLKYDYEQSKKIDRLEQEIKELQNVTI